MSSIKSDFEQQTRTLEDISYEFTPTSPDKEVERQRAETRESLGEELGIGTADASDLRRGAQNALALNNKLKDSQSLEMLSNSYDTLAKMGKLDTEIELPNGVTVKAETGEDITFTVPSVMGDTEWRYANGVFTKDGRQADPTSDFYSLMSALSKLDGGVTDYAENPDRQKVNEALNPNYSDRENGASTDNDPSNEVPLPAPNEESRVISNLIDAQMKESLQAAIKDLTDGPSNVAWSKTWGTTLTLDKDTGRLTMNVEAKRESGEYIYENDTLYYNGKLANEKQYEMFKVYFNQLRESVGINFGYQDKDDAPKIVRSELLNELKKVKDTLESIKELDDYSITPRGVTKDNIDDAIKVSEWLHNDFARDIDELRSVAATRGFASIQHDTKPIKLIFGAEGTEFMLHSERGDNKGVYHYKDGVLTLNSQPVTQDQYRDFKAEFKELRSEHKSTLKESDDNEEFDATQNKDRKVNLTSDMIEVSQWVENDFGDRLRDIRFRTEAGSFWDAKNQTMLTFGTGEGEFKFHIENDAYSREYHYQDGVLYMNGEPCSKDQYQTFKQYMNLANRRNNKPGEQDPTTKPQMQANELMRVLDKFRTENDTKTAVMAGAGLPTDVGFFDNVDLSNTAWRIQSQLARDITGLQESMESNDLRRATNTDMQASFIRGETDTEFIFNVEGKTKTLFHFKDGLLLVGGEPASSKETKQFTALMRKFLDTHK